MERKGSIMKKREYISVFSGILLILGGFFYYQTFHVVKEVEFPVVEEQEEEERLEDFFRKLKTGQADHRRNDYRYAGIE